MLLSTALACFIFAIGMNSDELKYCVTQKLKKKGLGKLYSLELDGSSWDSAQHIWWMSIDIALATILIPIMIAHFPLDAPQISFTAARCAWCWCSLAFG